MKKVKTIVAVIIVLCMVQTTIPAYALSNMTQTATGTADSRNWTAKTKIINNVFTSSTSTSMYYYYVQAYEGYKYDYHGNILTSNTYDSGKKAQVASISINLPQGTTMVACYSHHILSGNIVKTMILYSNNQYNW